MTDHDIKGIVKEGVTEFLLALGVDVSTPPAMLELQRDFHHVRATRLTTGKVRDKVISTLTGAGMMGIVTAIGFYVMRGN